MQQNKTLKNVKLYADDRKVKYVVVGFRERDLDTSLERGQSTESFVLVERNEVKYEPDLGAIYTECVF